jgi:hypothetical protein
LIASQFLARHLKAIENAGVLIVFPVLRFASASKNIGRTISKTFDRFYAVFTKRNEHLRRYTWNMLDTVCKTKLLSLTIKIHLHANSMRLLLPVSADQQVGIIPKFSRMPDCDHLLSSSGILAILVAIRRPSSRVSNFAADHD